MTNSIQESINNAINTIVNKRIDALDLDKTIIGIIDSVVDSEAGIYKIRCDGGTFNAKTYSENAVFLKGMSVYVQIPQNDMTKQKIIIGQTEKDESSQKTETAISSRDQYTIIGKNLLVEKNKKISLDKGLGIRSYHNPEGETEETVNHRAILLQGNENKIEDCYDIDSSALKIYRKEASAIMIEADFRTTLDINQQLQDEGLYGLSFDLKFKNEDYDIGETRDEIIKYFAKKISANGNEKAVILNPRYGTNNQELPYIKADQTVLYYKEDLEKKIEENKNKKNISSFIKESGYFDEYRDLISAAVQVFKENGGHKNLEGSWENHINFYLDLLEDLKYKEYKDTDTVKVIQQYYNEALLEKIASSEFNNIPYILNSDVMTDNPYTYEDWNTQYIIFKIDARNLEDISSILFYKDGFILNEEMCENDNEELGSEPWEEDLQLNEYEDSWEESEEEVSQEENEEEASQENEEKILNPREDIFVRNIKMYLLKPISTENGDYRLDISSPDGLILKGISKEDTLEIFAETTKAVYQDLSENASCFWFKKTDKVSSINSTGYHQYAGVGWYDLSAEGTNNSNKIIVYGDENLAYENLYKCVSVIDEKIILSQEFTVYNIAVKDTIKLESDLGTEFTFDSGKPLLTCLINDKEELNTVKVNWSETPENKNEYRYSWAIVINGKRTFLKDCEKRDSNVILTNIDDITKLRNYNNLLDNTTFFRGSKKVDSKNEQITRIKYNISGAGLENFITFECYVEKVDINQKDVYHEIGCGTLTLINKTMVDFEECKVVIENGDQIFQYDEYGNAPNAKKLKTPQEIKPLICHLYNANGLEIQNGNYSLSWIVPISDSMMSFNESLIVDPTTQKTNMINSVTQLNFNIADLYQEEFKNNQITCRVKYNGKTFLKDTNFYFAKIGENGTNGTDTVARITPVKSNVILDKQPLTLYRSNISGTTAAKLTLNSDGVTQQANSSIVIASNTGPLKAHLYLKNEEITSSVTVQWGISGSTQSFSKSKKFEVNSSNQVVWNEKQTNNTNYKENYIIRAKITFDQRYDQTLDNKRVFGKTYYIKDGDKYKEASDSNDSNSNFENGNFKAGVTYYEKSSKEYYAFYPLCQIAYVSSLPNSNRISIDKQFLLKQIVYNADGRNPIYSHSQGVKLNNLPKNYQITWTAKGGRNDSFPDFKLLEKKDGGKNEAKNSFSNTSNTIYILPNDSYGGSNCNNRVVAEVKEVYKDKNGTIIATILIATVTVPIYMSFNTFGLASLNAWDGNSVIIDNDRGAIYSPKVGAGEKDKNGRLTGIIMGKTNEATGGSENTNEIGLFGYAHGLQSIFLDAQTGNATFGLPDGNVLSENGNTLVPQAATDGKDYSEGRIELRPGGESVIGGWHLGRRALFYSMDYNDENTNGNKNPDLTLDKAYDNSGHERDLGGDKKGILLSADPSYLYIKGRRITETDIGALKESGILAEDIHLNEDESLAIQLDPQNYRTFGIYKHIPKRDSKGKITGWERKLLSGINGQGELVANSFKQIISKKKNEEKDIVTNMAVKPLTAFNKKVNSYIGINIGAALENDIEVDKKPPNPFFRAFVELPDNKDTDIPEDSTVYITTGYVPDSKTNKSTNDYPRPLSIHGKTISLYALDDDIYDEDDNPAGTRDNRPTQKSMITISPNEFYGGNSTSSYINLLKSGDSRIYTVGRNILTGGEGLSLRTLGYNSIVLNSHSNTDSNTVGQLFSYLKLDPNSDKESILRASKSLELKALNGAVIIEAQEEEISADKEDKEKNVYSYSTKSSLSLAKSVVSKLTTVKGLDITSHGAISQDTNGGNFTLKTTKITQNESSHGEGAQTVDDYGDILLQAMGPNKTWDKVDNEWKLVTTTKEGGNIILNAGPSKAITFDTNDNTKIVMDDNGTSIERKERLPIPNLNRKLSPKLVIDCTEDSNNKGTTLNSPGFLNIQTLGDISSTSYGNSLSFNLEEGTSLPESLRRNTYLELSHLNTSQSKYMTEKSDGTTILDEGSIFKIYNSQTGAGINLSTAVKKGYTSSGVTHLVATTGQLYSDTNALRGSNCGLMFDWGYLDGRIFTNNDKNYITDEAENLYLDTSLYAKHNIVSSKGIKAITLDSNDKIKQSTEISSNGNIATTGKIQIAELDKRKSAESGFTVDEGVTLTPLGNVVATKDVKAGNISLTGHKHSFSKGLVVDISDGKEQDYDMDSGNAGDEAQLDITATATLNEHHEFDYTGGEWEEGSFKFKLQKYSVWDGEAYSRGNESEKDPGYYRVSRIGTTFYQEDGWTNDLTVRINKNQNFDEDFDEVEFWDFDYSLTEIKENCDHKCIASVDDFHIETEISGISNEPTMKDTNSDKAQ